MPGDSGRYHRSISTLLPYPPLGEDGRARRIVLDVFDRIDREVRAYRDEFGDEKKEAWEAFLGAQGRVVDDDFWMGINWL